MGTDHAMYNFFSFRIRRAKYQVSNKDFWANNNNDRIWTNYCSNFFDSYKFENDVLVICEILKKPYDF